MALDFPNLDALATDFDLGIDAAKTHQQAIFGVLTDKIASPIHSAASW
jgi:hypothetical protein